LKCRNLGKIPSVAPHLLTHAFQGEGCDDYG
jgi:hypothetical protein